MIAPIITAVTLIILVFLSQKADLCITKKEKFEIRLSLTIFSYLVDTGREKKKKKKKRGNRKRHIRAKINAYKYLIRRSEVTLNELDPAPKEKTPLGYLSLAPVYAFYYSVAAYVSRQARSFKTDPLGDNPETTVEIKLSFVLYHLIIFFLISLYLNLKWKYRKRRRI